MKLGNILTQNPGVPIIEWPVEFHLIKETGGQKERIRIEAYLQPVSESERLKSASEAVQFLRTNPNSPFFKKLKEDPSFEIPEDTLSLERSYRFLMYALYSKEDSGVLERLITNDGDYQLFRAGCIRKVIDLLFVRYSELIEQEYPETLLAEQEQELEEEAAKKY